MQNLPVYKLGCTPATCVFHYHLTQTLPDTRREQHAGWCVMCQNSRFLSQTHLVNSVQQTFVWTFFRSMMMDAGMHVKARVMRKSLEFCRVLSCYVEFCWVLCRGLSTSVEFCVEFCRVVSSFVSSFVMFRWVVSSFVSSVVMFCRVLSSFVSSSVEFRRVLCRVFSSSYVHHLN